MIILRANDARTGETLLTRRYIGMKRQQVDKPSDAARRETMEAALARTMHDLAMDAALNRVPAPPGNAVVRDSPSRVVVTG